MDIRWICIHCIHIMYLDFYSMRASHASIAGILAKNSTSIVASELVVTQWGQSAEVRASSFLRDTLETISGTSKENKERTKNWFGFHKCRIYVHNFHRKIEGRPHENVPNQPLHRRCYKR